MSKTDISVGKLVEMVSGGELRLPEMQRRYVWPATRVRDLLDSLYRAYPSGTILVWETDQEMPSRDMDLNQAANPFKGHKLLLDGQQRLTSLAAVLRGEPVTVRNRKRPIDILFNLNHPDGPPVDLTEVDDAPPLPSDESENGQDDDGTTPNIQERLRQRTFVVSSRALAADPLWIKVADIFNPQISESQLLKGVVRSFDDPNFDKYSKRLQAVRKIREYQYVMQVLDKHLSYEEVAEIFVRVNSLGMKLRGSDLALAQITSRWKDSLQLFEEFQEECERQLFSLDLGLLVRSLVVFSTGQCRFKTVATIPVERLRQGWEKAKDGIRFATNFLRSNAGIENDDLLSSPFFVITLAYYADKNSYRILPDNERQLRRWLYAASAKGHYSGSAETTLDSDLNIISTGGHGTELIAAVEKQFGRLTIDAIDLTKRGPQSRLFTIAYLALKAAGAKDWHTRLGLSLGHRGREHFIEHHHIFPKSILKDAGYAEDEINEIANMVFISGRTNRSIGAKPATQYLAQIHQEQGSEALEGHCIPLDESLWSVENYRAFLDNRRASLALAINRLINGEFSKAPSLDIVSLIEGGESAMVEFKESVRWDRRENKLNPVLERPTLKTVAAFLNSKGGTLVLGVIDNGEICGIEADVKSLTKRPDRDGYEQCLINTIINAMGKSAATLCSVSFHSIEEHDVCAVHVSVSPAPIYVQDGQQRRFYVRAGNTTQELDTKDTVEYIHAHWPRT